MGVPNDAAALVGLRSGDRAFDREIDGVILVVGGNLLDRLQGDDFGNGIFGFDFFKDGEVPNQVEQGAFVEHSLRENFEFVGAGVVVDRAVGEFALPLAEAAVGSGERSGAGREAIGDHQQGVVGKEAGNFALVGLQLVEGGLQIGFGIGGVFEFDRHQGQSVDEQENVGAAVVVVFDDGELIDGEEFVAFWVVPVDQPERFAFGVAVVGVFDRDAFGQVAVEGFVAADQIGAGDALQIALGSGAGVGGNVGIEPIDRPCQSVFE